MENLQNMVEKLKKSKVIDKNGYKYIILPFDIKAIPDDIRIFSTALENLIKKTVDIESFDKIVTIESKGILISTLLALNLNKPLYIIRKRSYKLQGERRIEKFTGYERSEIFINGIFEHDKIIIIDDLISTGGTLKATLNVLSELNCQIKGIFVLFDKYKVGGSQEISNQFPYPLKSLIKLHIKKNDEVEVIL